jgi:DMSO/TMAO reductase YedYZ molybdopterin-dependent catalytic subunit
MRESEATPEAMFHDRRRVVQAMGFGALIAAAVPGDITVGKARAAAERDPSTGLYPAKRNEHCTLDRPITDEKLSTTYNNYYEFGSQKTIAAEAQALAIRSWTVTIDGMVAKPMTLDIDAMTASKASGSSPEAAAGPAEASSARQMTWKTYSRMITGIGMPRSHRRIPRMSHLFRPR